MMASGIRPLTEVLLQALQEDGVLRDPVDRLVAGGTPSLKKLRAAGEAGVQLLRDDERFRHGWCDSIRSELRDTERKLLIAWVQMRGGDQSSWVTDRNRKGRKPTAAAELKAFLDEWWLPSLSAEDLNKTAAARGAFPDAQRIGVRATDLPSVFALGCLLASAAGTGARKPPHIILPRPLATILVEAAWTAAVAEGIVERDPDDLVPKRFGLHSDWNWRDLDPGPVHEQQRTQGVGWWHGGN